MKIQNISTPGIRSILLSIFLMVNLNSFAQGTGNLVGYVYDELTESYLVGASVTVASSGQKVFSEEGGRFRLRNVPLGPQTLITNYQAYMPVRDNVEVRGDTVVSILIRMNPKQGEQVYNLDEFEVIAGGLTGNARANQLQKSSDALVSIYSSDVFGDFPDRAAAESLNRLPGVSIRRLDGQGDMVSVRGLNPDLNNFSVNGQRLSAGDTGGRMVSMAVFSSSNFERFEVNKVFLPELPGDFLGASVNLVTKSAFDRGGQFVNASIQHGNVEITDGELFEGEVTYGNVVGKDKNFGILITGGLSNIERGTEGILSQFLNFGSGDSPVYAPAGHQLDKSLTDNTRESLAVDFEYRPTDFSSFFLRGTFNHLERDQLAQRRTYRLLFTPSLRPQVGDGEAMFAGANYQRTSSENLQESDFVNVTGGGSIDFESSTLDFQIGWTQTNNIDSDLQVFVFETGPVPGAIGINWKEPRYIDVSPPEHLPLANPESYRFFAADRMPPETLRDVYDRDWSAALDWTRSLGLFGYQGEFKSGVAVRLKDRAVNFEGRFYRNYSGGSLTLADFAIEQVDDELLSGRYDFGLGVDAVGFYEFFKTNKDDFVPSEETAKAASNEQDSEIGEDVYAVYLQQALDIKSTRLYFGARLETTRTDLQARKVTRNASGQIQSIEPISANNDYTNILPAIVTRTELGENIVLRAGLTRTISRPRLDQQSPIEALSLPDPSSVGGRVITRGNPDLNPLSSNNIDLSIEYYTENLGMFSAGVFYKDIKDVTGRTTEIIDDPLSPGEMAQLTTYQNFGSAEVKGLELSFTRKMDFLPEPLDSFTLTGTYTYTDSTVDVVGRSGSDMPLPEQADHIISGSIGFNRWGFSANLAYVYDSEMLRSLNSDPNLDLYMDGRGQFDLSMSYRVNSRVKVFAEVRNLTDEETYMYMGDPSRAQSTEVFGRVVSFGLNIDWD
ncbi:MAG: TonB-dependent receptor [Puniceicoccaceae bacterium]